MTLPFLTSSLLTVRHGFFTRQGGTSAGLYDSLNCGPSSNDTPECVVANRALVAEAMGVAATHLASVYQVHSADVIVLGNDWAPLPERPKADAMVTRTRGIALSVLAADCAPILFADAEAGVIGAAHAGWKGALGSLEGGNVIENTIVEMESLGAARSNITAAIGPCIGQNAYEVGAEFRARFFETSPDYAVCFQPADKPGHFMFDLPGFVLWRLSAAGVKAEALGLDTYSDRERFYSYRRMTHMGAPDYGRQISVIALK